MQIFQYKNIFVVLFAVIQYVKERFLSFVGSRVRGVDSWVFGCLLLNSQSAEQSYSKHNQCKQQQTPTAADW